VLCCCDDRENENTSSSTAAAAADTFADSDAMSSFDIDDTPVTFRTRPTRARLVSAMLRQRSISQNVATSRVPTRSTPSLPRHVAVHAAASSTKDKMDLSSAPQSSLSTMQPTGQSSANVSVSEDMIEHALCPSLGKLTSGRRRRSSITRADECALKGDSDELRPVKVEPTTVSRVEALPSQDSISSPTVAAALDSSAEHAALQVSPIARNNETLVESLKRPPSYPAVQPDAVDTKKIRVLPASVSTPAAESKTSNSLHQLSPSSSSVTSRQPLSMRIDASKSTSSCNSATVAVTTKSNVIAPRFVSYCLFVT